MTIDSVGVLAGTGLITGATTITGSLRPGHSIGTKTVQNHVARNPLKSFSEAWLFGLGMAAAADGGSTQDLLDIPSCTGR